MAQVDIHHLSDHAKFNGFHGIVLFWCALIIIFDGYDLAVAGIALPSIMKEMGVTPATAGYMVSSALFGMMFGAIFLGTIADKIGRRWAIVICIVLFSAFTAAAGLTTDPVSFSITRFLAGLGIGGVMPNVVAQMTEYSPRKMRSTLVAVMFSGYSLGGMLAAGVGIYMLPAFGWQSMFFAAGIPLLLLPVILYLLPESVGFLVRQGRHEQARSILARVDASRSVTANDELVLHDTKGRSASVVELFREGRLLRTLCLWVAFFCCLLMVYALSSWLPKLMAQAGYSLGSSLSFLLALNFGGMAGAILGGWLGDRFNLYKVMVGFFAAAAVSISLLGFKSSTEMLYLLIFIAGATTIGTQILLYAGTAQFYGMSIRSTGLGWASGIGRNGAIVGPLLGGALMTAQLPLQLNFMVFAIPGAIAALAMLVFSLLQKRPAAAPKPAYAA